MSNITYTIELTPSNASKIDAINKILLGNFYSEEASKPAADKVESAKVEKSTSEKSTKKASDAPSITDLKTAAKETKAAHGEQFCMKVLEEFDVEVGSTLGQSISAIDESQYEGIIGAWKKGPAKAKASSKKVEDDEDEFDSACEDEEEDDSNEEVTAESVKEALKAYSKRVGREEAKEIMNKHGAATLSKVDDLPAKKLIAMMKELV